MKFKDQIVLITGAGSGIGKGIAEEFAKEGARVYILEIHPTNGEETAQEIREMGYQAVCLPTDVSNPESVGQTVSEIVKREGRIDILINNAGIEILKGLKELSVEEWDQVQAVDLKSIFLMSKECYPHMRTSTVKSIVNIASVHAYATVPGYDAYAAAKGGVVSLTRSMALTFREEGIRANGICPGFIDTPMVRRFLESTDDPEEYMKYILSFHPTGRIGTPKDIARACIFLSSEDASFINGEVLTVDGGLTIQLKH